MRIFEKFFGVINPASFAPILAAFYAVVGLVFMILCFGRWIMPHAETDLAIPWAVICILLLFTGLYGIWATTKGNTWHHRQFVSASWGFILMFLCWGIVYIAVEEHHIEKVNRGCLERNQSKGWDEARCDSRRRTAATIATVMVTIGMILGIYFTLVLSKWVSALEWEEHLEREKRLAAWRDGKGDNPHVENEYQIEHPSGDQAV